MNNGNSESMTSDQARSARNTRSAAAGDELTRLKQELLQAEVRLARARATAVGAEIDVRLINARLKEFAK
jgi:hypothetical protein